MLAPSPLAPDAAAVASGIRRSQTIQQNASRALSEFFPERSALASSFSRLDLPSGGGNGVELPHSQRYPSHDRIDGPHQALAARAFDGLELAAPLD